MCSISPALNLDFYYTEKQTQTFLKLRLKSTDEYFNKIKKITYTCRLLTIKHDKIITFLSH
jgi:hypothetical protein